MKPGLVYWFWLRRSPQRPPELEEIIALRQLDAPAVNSRFWRMIMNKLKWWVWLILVLMLFSGVLGDRATAVTPAGNSTLFLPLIHTPPGPPDFAIISPADGWTVSGMMYFAAQPRPGQPMTSVTFLAGSTPLGTDDTPEDGFRVFWDAAAYPAGDLTLTAVASGPGGETSQSITVNVVPDPPSSGTIGAAGGVLDSEIGSIIIIPPGALPEGTAVNIDELTQEEVTAQNGIDWEAMGVTFLGAQEIQSSNPFSVPYRVASVDFGNRVQPGQAVVNYQIVPDADGDGVDEIVVVNTASVAPNNDVISDPIPQVLLEETVVTSMAGVSGMSTTAVQPLGGAGGPPGTTIEKFVTGFNPLSTAGNVAEWTCADGTLITVSGTVRPNPAVPQGQIFSTVIPFCTPGPALVLLRNLSTGSSGGPFIVLVTAPPPVGGPPGTGTLDFLEDTGGDVNNIPTGATPPGLPPDWRNNFQDDLDEAREEIEDRMADPDPDNQQDLRESDTLLPPEEEEFPPPDPDADCLTEEAKGAIERQIDHLLAVASWWRHKNEDELGDHFFHMAQQLFQMLQLPTCEEDPDPEPNPNPDNEPACAPAPAAAPGGPTGMGSAPPPGGSGCGNAHGAGSGNQFGPRMGTGRMVIKIYSAGLPTPFSSVADPGGYFFIPFIPAGEPFTAIAYDLANNETRTMEGIGPETGDSVLLYFDFFREQEGANTVYWDGGGDGTSWHDPQNWNADTVPGPTHHVIIDVPGDVTVIHSNVGLDAIFSLQSAEALVLSGGTLDVTGASHLSHTLTLNGGALTGNGDVAVDGLFTWAYGSMGGPGTTYANGGISFSGSNGNGRYLDARTLQNEGTAVYQEGVLTAYNGAIISNQPGALFDFPGDHSLYVSTGGATFDNQGTVIKSSGSGTLHMNLPFNNGGVVNIQSGTLNLAGGGSHSGSFQGNGTLQIGDAHTLTGNLTNLTVLGSFGSLTINGSYDAINTTLAGSTFTVAPGQTAHTDTLLLNGGALSGDGEMVVAGLLTWAQGTMSGAGTTLANGGLIFSGNLGRNLDGRTLENGATAVFEDGFLTAYNGAIIRNLAGATFEFQGDDNLYTSTGGATFHNQGTVTKSAGSGTMTLYPAFVNEGSLDVQAGELEFRSDFTQTASGTLFVQIGGLVPITDFDQFPISGHATLDGTLDVTLTGGFVPDPGDSFAVMTYASRTGQFAMVNGHGQGYTTNYNPLDVTLVAQ